MTRFVYVVDDEAAVRESLRLLLGARGNLVVQSFASGDAFLESAHDREPGVVLLDLAMPGKSGLDVLEALDGDGRRFAPVVITGLGDVTQAVRAMRLGAVDFLEKPIDLAVLSAALDEAFARLAEKTTRISAHAKVTALSPREREVLRLLVDGASNRVVAEELGIKLRTAELHRANIMTKLDVSGFSALFRVALAAGLIKDTAGNT